MDPLNKKKDMKGIKITINSVKGVIEVYIVKQISDGYLVTEEADNVKEQKKMFHVTEDRVVKAE